MFNRFYYNVFSETDLYTLVYNEIIMMLNYPTFVVDLINATVIGNQITEKF